MSWCFSLQWFACLGLLLVGCEFDGSTYGTSSQLDASPPDSTPVTPLTIAAEPVFSVTSVKTFHFEWNDVQDATHYQLLQDADGESGLTQVGENVLQGAEQLDLVVPLHGRLNAKYVLRSCNLAGCLESAMLSVAGPLISGIGYVKSSNTDAEQCFGDIVALSGNGKTLAVGAPGKNGRDFCGDDESETNRAIGAVYLFEQDGSRWQQTHRLQPSNGDLNDHFGWALDLSDDGNTLAVGAWGESGIGGDEGDNSAQQSGAAYVFQRTGEAWNQEAYLKPNYVREGTWFGYSVALSADATRLAVGANIDDSGATGVNGDATDESENSSGAAYVFRHSAGVWTQEAYFKASDVDTGDLFGTTVALNGDGSTLAVGAYREDSDAIGVNGDDLNEDAFNSGAAYVFSRDGEIWMQEAYLKASNTEPYDHFGFHLTLDHSGDTLVVGAVGEDGGSGSGGLPGTENNDVRRAGAVYVFSRSSAVWSQDAYVKAEVPGEDAFGWSVALSGDGSMLLVGAPGQRSSASGVGGDQSDVTADDAGAAYTFSLVAGSWVQQVYLKASNAAEDDLFGWTVAWSEDGETIAVGANREDGSATEIGGTPDDASYDSGAVYLY